MEHEIQIDACSFFASSDFRHLRFKGKDYILSFTTSCVIEFLFQRWQEGSPYVCLEELQRRVKFRTKSLACLFRNHRDVYDEILIRRGRDIYALVLVTYSISL